MEIQAALSALNILKEPCQTEVYTDSAYLCNAVEKGWLNRWQRNGWKTASKGSVENQDLWKELLTLMNIHQVTFHKVKGHADNVYNNRCDELARNAIQEHRRE